MRSEPSAEAQHRPILDHVEFVAEPALILGVVHRERPVADHARERDALVGAELEAVAADGLPRGSAPILLQTRSPESANGPLRASTSPIRDTREPLFPTMSMKPVSTFTERPRTVRVPSNAVSHRA